MPNTTIRVPGWWPVQAQVIHGKPLPALAMAAGLEGSLRVASLTPSTDPAAVPMPDPCGLNLPVDAPPAAHAKRLGLPSVSALLRAALARLLPDVCTPEPDASLVARVMLLDAHGREVAVRYVPAEAVRTGKVKGAIAKALHRGVYGWAVVPYGARFDRKTHQHRLGRTPWASRPPVDSRIRVVGGAW